MGKVKVLDKHTAELIAAGEVVERPSSVAKELIENSIDAGAKNITVEIKNGGVRYLRVTDDGEGISYEDVPVAFLRHATSKISKNEDLDAISTLGFRGEALASVAAVSRVELITRTADEEVGTHYVIEGGEQLVHDECGCAKGSTIIIRDIFYNTPARMKFLKKDVSEGNAVATLVDRIALSHPEISFRFVRDGKEGLITSGDGKLKSAITSVFGRSFSETLIPVDYTLGSVRTYGFISRPVEARPNRTMQSFYINGRYCRSRTMQAAVEEAYKGSIMVGKFPACVLRIDMDCSAVDVNVHPAKLEVRFTNERPVFESVYYAVKNALSAKDERSNIELPRKNSPNPELFAPPVKTVEHTQQTVRDIVPPVKAQPQPTGVANKPTVISNTSYTPRAESSSKTQYSAPVSSVSGQVFTKLASNARDNALDAIVFEDNSDSVFAEKKIEQPKASEISNVVRSDAPQVVDEQPISVDTVSQEADNFELTDFRFIGEAFGTYIIIERGEELILIDKHAAHERLIYEHLIASAEGREPQYLLEPVVVSIDREHQRVLLENAEAILEAGFEIDDFGSGTVIVRSVPSLLAGFNVSDSVLEIAQRLYENKSAGMTEKLEHMYHTIACRSAVKAHDKMHEKELLELIKMLDGNTNVRYCPHGRPISISLKKREIEKNFGRIQ